MHYFLNANTQRSGSPFLLLLVVCISLLTGCSSSSDDDPSTGTGSSDNNPFIDSDSSAQSLAFISVRATNYTSSQLIRLSLTDGNIVTGQYPATRGDTDVRTSSQHVYQLGRSGLDSITSFDPLDTSLVNYQLSVNSDGESGANPQDIVFIDDSKAYITRRGSTKLWIVDPVPDVSPPTIEDFLISELDLGAYAEELPFMTDALIVDNRLYVLMERLSVVPETGFQVPVMQPYLAVFDTLTDTEIDTQQSGNNLKGIRLLTRNPTALQYNETTGQIYVIGRGNYFEAPTVEDDYFSGGVEVIDPITYQTTLLIDDGTEDDNLGYFINGLVINDVLGYLITGSVDDTGFVGNYVLRTFNPSTLAVSEPISGLTDESTTLSALLSKGPDNHLWIGLEGPNPGFHRIDLETGEIAAERIATNLIPSGISFLTVGE